MRTLLITLLIIFIVLTTKSQILSQDQDTRILIDAYQRSAQILKEQLKELKGKNIIQSNKVQQLQSIIKILDDEIKGLRQDSIINYWRKNDKEDLIAKANLRIHQLINDSIIALNKVKDLNIKIAEKSDSLENLSKEIKGIKIVWDDISINILEFLNTQSIKSQEIFSNKTFYPKKLIDNYFVEYENNKILELSNYINNYKYVKTQKLLIPKIRILECSPDNYSFISDIYKFQYFSKSCIETVTRKVPYASISYLWNPYFETNSSKMIFQQSNYIINYLYNWDITISLYNYHSNNFEIWFEYFENSFYDTLNIKNLLDNKNYIWENKFGVLGINYCYYNKDGTFGLKFGIGHLWAGGNMVNTNYSYFWKGFSLRPEIFIELSKYFDFFLSYSFYFSTVGNVYFDNGKLVNELIFPLKNLSIGLRWNIW